MSDDLSGLGVAEAAAQIRDGQSTSVELVEACLARIDATEPDVQAWQHLDRDYALEQARKADDDHRRGAPQGPLHGVPMGIKDIIDTADLPTENGTRLHAGRRPQEDASVVSRLRAAGAVIMGKTVTTELAFYSPGKTRNPHNPKHTPGGSSSGSAAAVAAGMVPAALGSQTNGSIIRPGSFCGVYAYKPSHGLISRHGVIPLSRALDVVGCFARSVEDVALVTDSLAGWDGHDPDVAARAAPQLRQTAMSEPPVSPRFAFVKTPVWKEADGDVSGGFEELAEHLGANCEEVALPEIFDNALRWHRNIMAADMAKNLAHFYEQGRDQLSSVLQDFIEEGRTVRATDYCVALDWIDVLNRVLDEIFQEFDAIITPAAPGEAPEGLEATGSPVFCSLWTLCGTPAITLPLLQGSSGLPIGVQLVAARGDDGRLLRNARALEAMVRSSE